MKLVLVAAVAVAALWSRLEGHKARIVGDDVVIDDVAGEGKPLVGVVERRGSGLWLVGDGFAVELRGPLARPRIAGPGYRVWAIGARTGDVLVARRIGVLAAPTVAPARD